MYPQYAVFFFLAAMLCSLVGRILLVGTAYAKGKEWGAIVLFAPFGPMFFRMKFEDLALPTRYYRMPIGPLMLLFFVMGGSVFSIPHAVMSLGRPDLGALLGQKDAAAAPAPVVAQATPAPKATPASAPLVAQATPAPNATPSPAVKAAAASMAAAPTILNLNERMDANRKEFARLADWYDTLKHERGYLRKNDADAIEAYNDEAAKYQTALQLAKTEQTELTKLSAVTAKK